MSLLSWGEGITVWLAPAPCGMRVYIESRPRQPTVVDWGRNQRNVDRIAAMITADPPRPVDVSMPQDRPA